MDEIVDALGLVGDEIDAPETIKSLANVNTEWIDVAGLPGIAVAGGEAHEAVGQVVLVDEAAELAALVRRVAHGLVVVSNNRLGDQGGVVIVVVPADTLDRDGDVGGGDGVIAYPDIRADKLGLSLGQEVGVGLGGASGQLGEVLVGHLDELLVGDATGTDEDHAVGAVVVLDVVDELSAGDVADVLLGSQDGAAEGLVLEGGGVQVVKDDLLDLLLDLVGLAQDHVPLALDGGLLELGVLEDVGEDVDTLRHILVQGLGEVDGVFTLSYCQTRGLRGEDISIIAHDVTTYRGVGVEVGAHVLDLELELLLCPAGGALSNHCQQAVP